MGEAIEKLFGYILLTSGFYMLYLLIFRSSRLPKAFTKLWVILLSGFLALVSIVLGWFFVQ